VYKQHDKYFTISSKLNKYITLMEDNEQTKKTNSVVVMLQTLQYGYEQFSVRMEYSRVAHS